MVGAASGRCRLELYRDPSCLIEEAPESRKEVSRLAYSLSSTVWLQYCLVIELELGVLSGTWSCPVSVTFSPCFFLVLNKLGMAISTFILESKGLA